MDVLGYNKSGEEFELYRKVLENETYEKYDFLIGFARMFYIILDFEKVKSYKTKEIPSFFLNAWPYFLLFILIESVVRRAQRRPALRLNDSLTSVSHCLLHELVRFFIKGVEAYAYCEIHANFSIINAQIFENTFLWYILGLLSVDFFYYWIHRACHEVHIFWAQHQVHHSSEDFNVTVGLRQSFIQPFGFFLNLPLAFLIPPAPFLVHYQFNLLFQIWVHTECIDTLPIFLEYVLNTPKHHRVHHGSNRHCLDRNYGGVLIVWDRIFGTFQEGGSKEDEKDQEKIVYGLVYNQPSFDIFHLQTFYTKYVYEKFKNSRTFVTRFCSVFYGPSWEVGAPRLGFEKVEQIIDLNRTKFDVKLNFGTNLYLLLHYICVLYAFHYFVYNFEIAAIYSVHWDLVTSAGFVVYFLVSIQIFGVLFNGNGTGQLFEVLRCVLLVFIIHTTEIPWFFELFYALSVVFWARKILHKFQNKARKFD